MSKNERDNAIFDAVFSKALEQAALEEIAELEKTEMKDIEFTAKHKREQRKAYKELEKRKKKPKWVKYAVRAAACLLVLCFLGGVIAFSIPTVRGDFMRLIAKPFEKYTSFGTISNSILGDSDYVFEYIPEGFELVKYEKDFLKTFRYKNVANETYFEIKYCQGTKVNLFQDNETLNVLQDKINNHTAYFIENKEDNVMEIVWCDGECIFYVEGNISIEILINIAKNINKNK